MRKRRKEKLEEQEKDPTKVTEKDKVTGFFKGFKAFITRGNIIDMAVGIVIGTAFTAVITALVNGIIMPPIGYAIGQVDFSQLSWVIGHNPTTGDPIAIMWGTLVQAIINFIIIAFCIYCILTLIIRRKKFNESLAAAKNATPATPPPPSPEVVLLTEIRDLIAKEDGVKIADDSSNQKPAPTKKPTKTK